MTRTIPPDVQFVHATQPVPPDTVVDFPGTVSQRRSLRKVDHTEASDGQSCADMDTTHSAEPCRTAPNRERGFDPRDTIVPGLPFSQRSHRGDTERQPFSVPRADAYRPSESYALERSQVVRNRVNAAVCPILRAHARKHGILTEHLEEAIDGPAPLTDPTVVRRLAGAIHSDPIRKAIADNVDLALVPLKVRAGLAAMMAQNLTHPPSNAVKKLFPDWDKPLVPFGQYHRTWQAQDAAEWLEHFPPSGHVLHPMDTWDDVTAARWLNDRDSLRDETYRVGRDSVVSSLNASTPWKPALEILHTLDELEHEELAYRVFVERFRRDVMPAIASERRINIQNAIRHTTTGYHTFEAARRSVHQYDTVWINRFDQLFIDNDEWIYDLCRRILYTYTWPIGLSQLELCSDFPK